MFTPSNNNFSEIVDIVLYKYNLIDARLWSLMRREKEHRVLDQGSILINAHLLKDIINENFRSEINKFHAMEGVIIYKEATSIYFIWKMLSEISSLRWVKINLIKNANYSRVVTIDEMKTIKFSIKTIRGTFKTFDHFNKHELPLVNSIFQKTKILQPGKAYNVVRLGTMLSSLDLFLSHHNTSEMVSPISTIINELEDYEVDNPEVLVITDYDSDI